MRIGPAPENTECLIRNVRDGLTSELTGVFLQTVARFHNISIESEVVERRGLGRLKS